MKLRDIIGAAGNRLDWIHFDWNWKVGDGGNIIPTLPVELNLDSEVAVIYQWFHHCNRDINTREVWDAIENHDYATFCKWFAEYEDSLMVYFPSEASVHIDGEYVGDVCVVYNEKMFNLITDEDCECG